MATPTPLRPRPGLLNITIKSAQENAKDKILTLRIPQDVIIRIADEINASKSPVPTGITQEDYSKLTQEQKRLNKLPIIVTLSNEPYHVIFRELSDLFESLKNMSGNDVIKLYEFVRTEQITIPHIEFNIVRSPLSERLIANVTTLRWNGVDLLEGQNIMLYKSTGESRSTGLGDYWLPYLGERFNRNVAKLEDNYIKGLEYILSLTLPIPDYYKPILVDIITNVLSYNYYKRFIDKKYLIASFLLFSESNIYNINPSNQEHISRYIRNYTDEEKSNALRNIYKKIMILLENNPNKDYIPITADVIDEIIQPSQTGSGDKYFIKYLKYKKKYFDLRKNN
jgi:hypothetical protein